MSKKETILSTNILVKMKTDNQNNSNNKENTGNDKKEGKNLDYSKSYKDKVKKKFKAEDKVRKLTKDVEKYKKQIDKLKNEAEEETIIEIIREDYQKAKDFITEPKHVRVLKIIIILIPVMILLYLLTINFLISQEFNYFYDIDSDSNYLSPLSRITGAFVLGNTEVKNLTSSLVYFDVPIPRGTESLTIQTKLKDNFPDSVLSLGAKDRQEWHYLWNLIYNPELNNLKSLPKKDNVYLVNPEKELTDFDNLLNKQAVIATDKKIKPIPNIIDYENKETIINTTLRGGHEFYIYTSGNLNLEVKKQDINWYDNSDELSISLYDLNDELIANTTIEDDGIDIVSREIPEMQSGSLEVNNLEQGTYKLVFSDFDGLIREIKINTNKIVSEELYLADNTIFLNLTYKKAKLYAETSRPIQLAFRTWHDVAFQDIQINEDIVKLNQRVNATYANLSSGEHNIIVNENDIIISSPSYLSFSKENYFKPFKQTIVGIRDWGWMMKNVDYIVTDYEQPERDKGTDKWIITETQFNINEDELVIKDNKLNLVFNIPHLSNEQYKNYTIPIDWINISVYKPGLLEKLEWI